MDVNGPRVKQIRHSQHIICWSGLRNTNLLHREYSWMSEWQMSFNAAFIYHLKCHHGLIFKRIAGWWFQTCFSIIYGMSSFPLTNSYFSRWLKPPTSIAFETPVKGTLTKKDQITLFATFFANRTTIHVEPSKITRIFYHAMPPR